MTETGDEPTIRLGDRYELGGLLGRGGMADVRVGRDLRLGRTVAVKMLRADLASDETFQERFRREAQSAASLNHPSIVAVYDTGETTDASGTHIPYIVMEYVEGHTLREILRDGRKILPERALSISSDVLKALDYSHRAGIIHRDIKPANVMLTPSGQVKVMDFGIARAIADASTAMTQTAAVIGTAQYLSPEQARGETVDARSDIYSTGCLLYELLTGRPPFVGESPVSVAYQHVREEARPPSQLNPDVSASVDHVVAKALAKRVDERYQSAGDMQADLERVLNGGSVSAPTAATAIVPGATAVAPAMTGQIPTGRHTGVTPAVEDDEEEPRGGKGKWWAIGLLLVALLGIAGWAIYDANKAEPVPQVEVPSVAGDEVDVATRVLTDAKLTVNAQVEERPSADVERGKVIATDPPEGTSVDEGSEITLIVSTGPEPVTIPNVVNLTYEEAEKILTEEGLKVKRDERPSDQAKDTVLATNPPAGTQVDPETEVTVIVSQGQVTVPQVTGMSFAEAKKALEDLNLKVTREDDTTSPQPPDTVLSQSIPQGQKVAPGTTVTLVVAKAPDPPGDDADADADGG